MTFGRTVSGLETWRNLRPCFGDYVVPLADKTTFLKPGDDVAPGIRAVEAFGHTPGHLAFRISGGGNKDMFFLGDCAHRPRWLSLARPDWHCVFDVDAAKGAETRVRIFDVLATERIAVSAYPYAISIDWICGKAGVKQLSLAPTLLSARLVMNARSQNLATAGF